MFVNFMEEKGYSWKDFDYCSQMALLIEEYAEKMSMAHDVLPEVRASISRIESYCGDIDIQRGVRNIIAECKKLLENKFY